METFEIVYLKDIQKNDLSKISISFQEVIKKAIEDKLKKDPLKFGMPLRKELVGFRRLRIGKYRVIYKVEKQKVLIVKIGIRDKVYD